MGVLNTRKLAFTLAFVVGAGFATSSFAQTATDTDEQVKRPASQTDETAEGFNLDALIAAARKEGPITVYDESGKIVPITKAFTEKYGIQATGLKLESGSIEKIRRESEANNIIADVFAYSDPATVAVELVEDGTVTNWVPGDLADKMPDYAQFPLLISENMLLWAYNEESAGATCPVDNIWALTDSAWKGRVSLPDPESRTIYTNWWSQAARNSDEAYRKAYRDHFGEDLKTDQPTAVHEWVKRLAMNQPIVFKNDEGVSDAVGATGQANAPIGLMHAAKFRNNAEKGYRLAPCAGLSPWMGTTVPQSMTYVTKTKNVNAAKLFIHFALSQTAMDFIMPDGRLPYVSTVKLPADAHGLFALRNRLQPYDTSHLRNDYYGTSEWQDLWRSNR